jgi:hypothetical protein
MKKSKTDFKKGTTDEERMFKKDILCSSHKEDGELEKGY